jgi:hypothetical protein
MFLNVYDKFSQQLRRGREPTTFRQATAAAVEAAMMAPRSNVEVKVAECQNVEKIILKNVDILTPPDSPPQEYGAHCSC